MRVLHVVAGQLTGGAARGAYWLHRALCELGVDSKILSNVPNTIGDETVYSIAESRIERLKVSISRRLGRAPLVLYPQRQDVEFNTGLDGMDISRHPAYQSADLIHLHWVNSLLNIRSLRKFLKPTVWTLRDMWPMTGGCHQSMECERFQAACGRCPQLASESVRDLSRFVLRHKQRFLPQDLQIVGISSWIADRARCSTLLGKYPITTIGNNIDTGLFVPLDKSDARRELGLDEARKYILIGAQFIDSVYKGFDLFLDALHGVDANNTTILTIGRRTAPIPDSVGFDTVNLGFVTDPMKLSRIYSAANVFVAPSRADAFGKMLVEAMACGTPVVCFDATGPRDIVEHRVSGYKAQPFEIHDFASGINWILSLHGADYYALSDNALVRARKYFDSKVIAAQYLELYETRLRADLYSLKTRMRST